MKKILCIIFLFTIILCSTPVCAQTTAPTEEIPLGIDIDGEITLGNTNANLSLGGYMAPLKDAENYEYSFYAYYNPPFYFLGGAADLRNEDKQGLIKYTRGKIDDITSDTSVDVLSYGFNCNNINNYEDEWIFFMKNNDGCIYKVKTDGTKETKLDLPFFVRRFLLVNDRLIIETQFSEYGKILSTNLNGEDLRLIAKCKPRCGDMMIQADENGVYYYDDVNLAIKRISYDGKEDTIIYKAGGLYGQASSGAPVLTFQVSNNKIILRTYDLYCKERVVLLDLDKPLGIPEDFNDYLYGSKGTRWEMGLPFFEYQPVYILDDNCFNFSDDGCFVLSSKHPENYILGYDELSGMPDRYYVYKLDLNYIDKINNGINGYSGSNNKWDDEVFYEGYVDIMGGSDYDYSLYVLNDEPYLYDPVRYLNITGLRFFSDTQISYREPNYREPPEQTD